MQDFPKPKKKLKKKSQGLNLLRHIKIAVLFAICNIVIYCRAACPGGTVSATESSSTSISLNGAITNKLSDRGYSLTQSKMWKSSSSEDEMYIYGIELTYSSDRCGYTDIVHMYGSPRGSYIWSVSITQKVTAVKFIRRNGGQSLRDIWFTLADGSIAKTCNCKTF